MNTNTLRPTGEPRPNTHASRRSRSWLSFAWLVALLALGAHEVWAQTPAELVFQWSTVAGQPGGGGDSDGAGSVARFAYPDGVALDSAGNLYVADWGNNTIRKITPGGVVTTLAGLAGSGNEGRADGTGSAARFSGPSGVAVDNAGNVYVADYSNNTIRKITPGAVVTTLAGLAAYSGSVDGTGSAARFSGPSGVAVDSAGNVYVADSGNNTIRKITPDGVVTTVAGLAGNSGSADGTGSAARFYYPEGIAVDTAGNVFVVDGFNYTIRKITPGGMVTTLAGLAGSSGSTDGMGSAARFNWPSYVAVDSAGNVYVADFGNHTIRKITAGGVVTTLAGLAGSQGSANGTGSAARFNGVNGLAVDSDWNVYVGDSGNRTIRKIAPGGVVRTLAGLAGGYGSADGTGSAAQFEFPRGVAVDNAGNAYVADADNDKIRKITPGGGVTTLAGLGYPGSMDGTGSGAWFDWPTGVAVDNAGSAFVADSGNYTIRKMTLGGVVTTLAGLAGSYGSADGTGSAARFSTLSGVAAQNAGYVFVADTQNHTIRMITTGGVVTTLAGLAGRQGTANGTGGAARFNNPGGVAVDSNWNVYVADSGNSTIRKIAPGGIVTTLAGLAGSTGSADGTGSTARFNGPSGIAVDSTGNVFVADTENHTIRMIKPDGMVTTLGGFPSQATTVDGVGTGARFNGPTGIAIDTQGRLWIADELENVIRLGTPLPVAPLITQQPLSQNVHSGELVWLSVLASGYPPPQYQWRLNGTNLPGQTSTMLFLGAVTTNQAGLYSVVASNAAGVAVSSNAVLTVSNTRPMITVQPQSQTNLSGTSVGFSVTAVGSVPFGYQWLKDGVTLSDAGRVTGAKSGYLVISNLQTNDAGAYTVVVTNVAGSVTSQVAWLTVVVVPPSITVQPESRTNVVGTSVGFGISATGTAPLGYQWFKDGVNLSNTGRVSGATSNYLAISNIQTEDTGRYTVVVSNLAGAVTSQVAVLTVVSPPLGYLFSTVAGQPGGSGYCDAAGSAARFAFPVGAAVDSAGNVYVADADNHTIRRITPGGAVTTLAGLAGNPGSADGTGSAARFKNPRGVAADNAGNVYVADTDNDTIRKITPVGLVTTLAGLAGSSGSADGTSSAARFSGPCSVAVDRAGNVYVADTDNDTIRQITPGGVVTTVAGLAGDLGSADGTGSAARFCYPGGVTVDAAGNVYVADTLNHTIRKVTPGRVVTTVAGLAESSGSADGTGSAARFYYPQGVAVDAVANVYVADDLNRTIRKITPDGVVTTVAGLARSRGSGDGTGSAARFYNPRGIAVDNAGNAYVADSDNYTIRKITPGGVVTTLAGLAGSYASADGTGGAARFNGPVGVAVDSAGNAYVADTYSHTIRKIMPGGVVTTLAGLAGTSGSADGTGSAARFNGPQGPAVDGTGNVYVADTYNHTIRKITPGGVVTTLAGVAQDLNADGFNDGGFADGTGSAAQFDSPDGTAVDGTGNVYVADAGNSAIRKITPGGVVTTLAGLAGSSGSMDGTGSAARFAGPGGLAVDSAGNVYVADAWNNTIRKVTPGGVVTTLAGLAQDIDGDGYNDGGFADANGSAARFNLPFGVVVDTAMNVYVADNLNHAIRKVTPAGVVTTLGGSPGEAVTLDGVASAARFNKPTGIAIDAQGQLWIVDQNENVIRLGVLVFPTATLAGLELVRSGTDLTLQYWLQSTQGVMTIYRADRPEWLGTNATVFYTGQIPASGQGTLTLSNWIAWPRQFFRLVESP